MLYSLPISNKTLDLRFINDTEFAVRDFPMLSYHKIVFSFGVLPIHIFGMSQKLQPSNKVKNLPRALVELIFIYSLNDDQWCKIKRIIWKSRREKSEMVLQIQKMNSQLGKMPTVKMSSTTLNNSLFNRTHCRGNSIFRTTTITIRREMDGIADNTITFLFLHTYTQFVHILYTFMSCMHKHCVNRSTNETNNRHTFIYFMQIKKFIILWPI